MTRSHVCCGHAVRAALIALALVVLASANTGLAAAQTAPGPLRGESALEALVSRAQAPEPARQKMVQIDLLAETAAIRPGQPFWVALRQTIAPGWHTYWRNPGDSGEPTRIDWDLPEGFAASEIHWPAPEAVPVSSLMNYGYHDEALLLVRITPPQSLSAQQVRLRASSTWLVCEQICIPEDGEASLSLAVASGGAAPAPGNGAEQIAQGLRNLPRPAPWPAELSVSPEHFALSFDVGALAAEDLDKAHFFANDWGMIDHAAAQTFERRNGEIRVVLRRGETRGQPVERLDGVLVVAAHEAAGASPRAYEVSLAPSREVAEIAPAAPPGGITGSGLSLWQAAAFAFLGGLILNFFPCVFPVLSMKALSLARGGSSRADRRHALAYFVGVMASFAALAAILLALRATGAAMGWGFQFQSPWFVLSMAALFFALGLSLSGVFNFGGALTGVGDQLTRRGGASGSFFTGVLASIAATPCTAPFMGAALGFAMTQPPAQAATVLMVLGLGFAAPMTLLSLSGAFARLLPKPGPWMETLKQALAFPLYATAVWLIWVLSLQTGANGVLAAGAVLLAIAFAAWLAGMTRAGRGYRYAGAAVVIAGAFALAAPMIGSAQQPRAVAERSAAADAANLGEPFSLERLKALRDEGRPVFVNLTAAWCITCKVNEEIALNSQAFRDSLSRGRIAYLIGDWTNQDAEISQMLAKFDRAGVPLYLLYPAGGSAPEVLPQILTEGMVLRRFAEASATRTTRTTER